MSALECPCRASGLRPAPGRRECGMGPACCGRAQGCPAGPVHVGTSPSRRGSRLFPECVPDLPAPAQASCFSKGRAECFAPGRLSSLLLCCPFSVAGRNVSSPALGLSSGNIPTRSHVGLLSCVSRLLTALPRTSLFSLVLRGELQWFLGSDRPYNSHLSRF